MTTSPTIQPDHAQLDKSGNLPPSSAPPERPACTAVSTDGHPCVLDHGHATARPELRRPDLLHHQTPSGHSFATNVVNVAEGIGKAALDVIERAALDAIAQGAGARWLSRQLRGLAARIGL